MIWIIIVWITAVTIGLILMKAAKNGDRQQQQAWRQGEQQ